MPRGVPNQKPMTVIGADVNAIADFDGERPAESEKLPVPQVKKGRRSWGRRDLLGVKEKDPSFVYRWVRKDAKNIAQKLQDGWEYDDAVVNSKAVHQPTERMYDGANLTTSKETHDSILMRLPNDIKEDRDHWLDEQNALRESMLKRNAEKGAGTSLKGSIDIQSGDVKNIIE